jgi:hypothetical protein
MRIRLRLFRFEVPLTHFEMMALSAMGGFIGALVLVVIIFQIIA